MPTPWSVNPPTSLADLKNIPEKALPAESEVTNLLSPAYSKQHTRYWFPDMASWSVNYSRNGLNGCRQTWIAPWAIKGSSTVSSEQAGVEVVLPIVVRQLLSWNRERFDYQNKFWDLDTENGSPRNLSRPLVVTDIELIPRPELLDLFSEGKYLADANSTTFGIMAQTNNIADTWDDEGFQYAKTIEFVLNQLRMKNLSGQEQGKLKLFQQIFPRVRSQFWQVNLTWTPDEYVNRFGIRYAKIEIMPSLRLESLKNKNMGIVPTDKDGQPNFDIVDDETQIPNTNPAEYGNPDYIETITTGFPVREPQITIKVTYPWVSLTDLANAGPIGNPSVIDANGETTFNVSPGSLPLGQFLGTVNRMPFLGYSRGRVLYNAAEIEETTSPVTGRIGYKVSHEFIVNTNMEWNQTRYSGTYVANQGKDANNLDIPIPFDLETDTNSPSWPTGFMVMKDSTMGGGKVYRMYIANLAAAGLANQALYPYPYKELNDLLYYGKVGDGQTFPSEG